MSNVAYTTVNQIVKEVFESYEKGVNFTRKKIELLLCSEGMETEKITKLLELAGNDDPFKKARDELETEKKRLKFIENTFPNVKPETIVLSHQNSPAKDTYQYVPIKSSLKYLLEDKTYIKQKANDPYNHDPNVIKDVRDGECFRKSTFFQQHPEAVPLIVFIDELEVCNPLGAGKTKHKFNCCYFSTLDIQPALRSKVQSIQLVSIVSSRVWKKYGNDACNQRLVSDLKDLENDGIEIVAPVIKTVRAGLQYIVGDNLGQHNIAEMNQAFSSGYICRWCKATYNQVCRDGQCYSGCQDGFRPDEWTVEDYDECAKKAEDEEEHDREETCGVKRNCVFNQLQSFHCILQLPPCLGHDLFEGCLSYDIQFFLDYIINKEKLISQEDFNQKIKNVLLSSRDSGNRPREFKTRKKNQKYEGNAGSLRVLGRVITILLSGVLENSEVGNLIIKLQEVSELVTAPKLTKYEVDNILHFTIIEYLELRVEAIEKFNMQKIKPKHHFLSHYPTLFKFHGPLIHLWAMRMESKHQFFKNCIRTSKNFINPTKTCAVRHQRAQISYGYQGLFPDKFEVPVNTLTAQDMRKISSDEFLLTFMADVDADTLIPKNIKIFGTKYEAGMVLIISKGDFGTMVVGVLKAISFHKEIVMFGCTVFEALLSKHCYYVTTKKVRGDFQIINHSNLADHQPLQRIGTIEDFIFPLHHFVSQTEVSL